MKKASAILVVGLLSGCASFDGGMMRSERPAPAPSNVSDAACGADALQDLVGGPVSATLDMDIPPESRYYGRAEPVDPKVVPTRLNFVVSTDQVFDSVGNPEATFLRVFCG